MSGVINTALARATERLARFEKELTDVLYANIDTIDSAIIERREKVIKYLKYYINSLKNR